MRHAKQIGEILKIDTFFAYTNIRHPYTKGSARVYDLKAKETENEK